MTAGAAEPPPFADDWRLLAGRAAAEHQERLTRYDALVAAGKITRAAADRDTAIWAELAEEWKRIAAAEAGPEASAFTPAEKDAAIEEAVRRAGIKLRRAHAALPSSSSADPADATLAEIRRDGLTERRDYRLLPARIGGIDIRREIARNPIPVLAAAFGEELRPFLAAERRLCLLKALLWNHRRTPGPRFFADLTRELRQRARAARDAA